MIPRPLKRPPIVSSAGQVAIIFGVVLIFAFCIFLAVRSVDELLTCSPGIITVTKDGRSQTTLGCTH